MTNAHLLRMVYGFWHVATDAAALCSISGMESYDAHSRAEHFSLAVHLLHCAPLQ